MGSRTKIEWTDATWNPVTGCSKVSAGCANCYAERLSHRFKWTTKPWNAAYAAENVRLHPERLAEPLRWKKPRRVFVCSMADLFHEAVPDEFIFEIWATMASAPQHTFLILTKRPQRMRDWVKRCGTHVVTGEPALKNVWLGVSVENQKAADERIPLLLETPAVVRFVSAEPLLGPLDLSAYLPRQLYVCQSCGAEVGQGEVGLDFRCPYCCGACDPDGSTEGLDWVIVGGESGPGARPMHPDWVRSLRDQCREAGVPFFFKQWGEWSPDNADIGVKMGFVALDGTWRDHQPFGWGRDYPGSVSIWKVGKKKAGRLLDGQEWNEIPEVNAQ